MRKFLLTCFKIVISAALLYAALRKTDFIGLSERFDWSSVGWLGLGIICGLLQVLVGGIRWQPVSATCDAPITLRQASRYNLIGSFFNQTLPSSIGGDAVRLWLLLRVGVGWRAATYSIFVDRAIGLIALALLVVASLPWSYSLISDPAGRTALLIVDVISLSAGAGFLMIGWLPWHFLKHGRLTHHIYACSRIANRLIFNIPLGLRITVYSLSIHLLAIAVAWCVIRSIDAQVSYGQIFLLIPPVMLITLLPVSIAGWGLREATMGLAFGYAGLSTYEGVNVSLLFGGIFLVVGAIGGLAWIGNAEKAAQAVAFKDQETSAGEP